MDPTHYGALWMCRSLLVSEMRAAGIGCLTLHGPEIGAALPKAYTKAQQLREIVRMFPDAKSHIKKSRPQLTGSQLKFVGTVLCNIGVAHW